MVLLTVHDELHRVESYIVRELKGAHGITTAKFHGNINVLFGSMAWGRNQKLHHCTAAY